MDTTTPAKLEDLTDPPKTVLVVVAHPDDIDFGIAGTAAALTRAGSRVVYRLATSGEAGGPDEMDRSEMARLRESEQCAAAAAVGVSDVEFMGLPDGRLEFNLDLRREMTRIIRMVKPDLLITQNPERNWDRIFASHPDHLAVGAAAVAAAYPDSRNPHSFPELLEEGLESHTVPELWIPMLEPVDVFVDITLAIEQKIQALKSHSSQVAWIEDIDSMLREWSIQTAVDNGFVDGVLIEAFRRIRTVV